MTSSLRSRLVSGSINASLAEIDLRTRDIDNPPTGDIVVGPFAVLGLPTPESPRGDKVVHLQAQQDGPDSVSVESEGQPTQPVSPPNMEDSSEPIGQLTTFSQASFLADPVCHFDDFLHWSDLLGCSPDALGWNSAPITDDMDLGTNIGSFGAEFETDPMSFDGPENVGSFPLAPDGDDSMQTTGPTEMASTLLYAASLAEAPFLFKHFHDNVIPQTMPMPLGKKSPWKILNVPAAMMTYSDLTILGYPAVLDDYVDNVITALADFQKAVPAEHPMSPATAWPMFIAGCEALTASKRDAVLEFFNRAESICRFPIFKTAREILTDVWNQQDQHLETNRRDPIPTWINIVRQKNLWPLFC